ncbi:DNA polymerase III subunit tau/gamma [Holospora obtusa F1]|uniref:DNA polymerase III subunit gamma/tau n=1 Tax=Holospora obtusa F1 TaxID=1399147 RepID=W6TDY6_HOLOB|nr:DNA polymerase III subunit gamma/tau [Holospora obtusa]ETZ06814.1 DNA polymerase III subunit tau/gamma [Holospora obtusa F1]
MYNPLSAQELSHYRVLARKYRPNFFKEVVGQCPFVEMIQNALSQPKIPGGILLTGTRGIGKTTLARLIAKTLTCHELVRQRSITPLEPCGLCTSCQSCSLDTHLDIQEIDAASHTGVDDIRGLLESCHYRSLSGAFYRVYIIDEVHMLSKSAFNALLKTLEEPPLHVSFVFATTEAHKIPKTIVSRCQQFHLKRLEDRELKNYLKSICLKEDIVCQDPVYDLLVQHSEGSVRDAFSLLERSILLAGKELDESVIRNMLGLPQYSQVYETLLLLGKQDIPALLKHVKQLYYAGIDPKRLLEQIAQGLYCIVLEQFSVQKKSQENWDSLTDYFGISDTTALWQCIIQGFEELEKSMFPFISLEMLLIRMAHMKSLPNLEHILDVWSGKSLDESHEHNQEVRAKQSHSQKTFEPRNMESSEDFRNFLYFLGQKKEDLLSAQLMKQTNFCKGSENSLYLYWLCEHPPETHWIARVSEAASSWAGKKIIVHIHPSEDSVISWEQQELQNKAQQTEQLMKHPLVQKMQNVFPGLQLDE